MPLSIGTFPEGSENGRFFGPAFWCRRATFELVLGSVQSGRGATISSARCIRITPKCSQLLLVLNTYSFQTIKLKLAAFLPSAAPTEEAPCEGLRFKERVRQVIFRYAPLEWFGKSTLGTCIWGGVKTDVVLVDLDPSDKQQMWNG